MFKSKWLLGGVMYKFILCLGVFLFVAPLVQATERVSLGHQATSYSNLQDTVKGLEDLRDMIETSITIIKSCGDANQAFDGTAGCLATFTEEDPSVLTHSRAGAAGDVSVTCVAQNEALVYDGSSWVCKTMAP